MDIEKTSWQTKPTDRFVLRWIKVHLSARVTPGLLKFSWIITSSSLGVLGGLVFALGSGWLAASIAAIGQVLDGVDGQFARLMGRDSKGGAFLDSVLDRYADGAMVIGTVIYLIRLPLTMPTWLLLILGSATLIGGNLISYSTSRAENLSIDTGPPTLVSKGTRMTVMIICGWGTIFWPSLPILAIVYLAIHTNVVVMRRLIMAHRGT
jgi:phosphatidylglycerophosphate synthase